MVKKPHMPQKWVTATAHTRTDDKIDRHGTDSEPWYDQQDSVTANRI